jgi:hypothetical protein
MDPRRFDNLTRSLARSHSRRTILRGVAGVALGGLFTQLRGEAASAAPTPTKPTNCLPDGKKSKNSGRCCSLTTNNKICCGVAHGSCALSGCCGAGVCHLGACVDCLPEGTVLDSLAEAISCCSLEAEQQGNGPILCCGVEDGTCAASGCCNSGSATPFCYSGLCLECLPGGAVLGSVGDTSICCSRESTTIDTGDIVCCADKNNPCDTSQCCGGGQVCRAGFCCVPGGGATDTPTECCSGSWSNGHCCPEDGSCIDDGCCVDSSTCCNGACYPPCANGQSRDPDTCACGEAVCSFCEPGAIVSGYRCGDNGCPAPYPCRDGVCVGQCFDGTLCPLGTVCSGGVAGDWICCPPCQCFNVDGVCSGTPPLPGATCPTCTNGTCADPLEWCEYLDDCCGSCVNGRCT